MSQDIRFKKTPLFGCSECLEDFASMEVFDKHRVGTFEPNDRHCLTETQMLNKGWQKNKHDRWFDPKRTERAARYFGNENR